MNNKKHRDVRTMEDEGNVSLKSKSGQDGEKKTGMTSTKIKPDLSEKIVMELKHAYEMELETVINYLANSVHLDGILAQEIRESLKQDITEELGHATQLAERLKILNSDVPGSLSLTFDQRQIQPPEDTTDVMSVIKGVIEGEKAAIAQYEKLIDMADDADDWVTEDLCIKLLGDEQHHLREFEGFLKSLKTHPLK